MPQKIVAGNWKMNLEMGQVTDLIEGINDKKPSNDVRVIVFPSAVYVNHVSEKSADSIEVGVQNFYTAASGAYTGELSIPQIKSVGGTIGLIGHSERRAYFGEDHAFLKNKVDFALENNFDFIFCCGEPLEVREAGNEYAYVKQQLDESLFHLTQEELEKAIIAYEPVWAIGTGKTATADQAEAMHAEIRSWIVEKYGEACAQNVSILYGGSCNQDNAKELFSCPNVDGGLIGGASLKPDAFSQIIDSFNG